MNHFDDVAIDRALKGDRTVRLTEDEVDEITRRVADGRLNHRVMWEVAHLSGSTAKKKLDQLRRTS